MLKILRLLLKNYEAIDAEDTAFANLAAVARGYFLSHWTGMVCAEEQMGLAVCYVVYN